MKRLLTLLIFSIIASSFYQQDVHAWGSPKPKVSYKNYNVEGFNVRVLNSIAQNSLVQPTLSRLGKKLKELKKLSPRKLASLAGKVTIWLSNSNNSASMVYHPSAQWLQQNGQNPDFGKGIEIANLKNYLAWNVDGEQPMMVLHELSHAYHDQILSFENSLILNSFASIRDSKIYESVLYRNRSGPYLKAYALTNEKEYFAELSESYFGVNDYYPFVRSELQTFDPVGYQLMLTVWGK